MTPAARFLWSRLYVLVNVRSDLQFANGQPGASNGRSDVLELARAMNCSVSVRRIDVQTRPGSHTANAVYWCSVLFGRRGHKRPVKEVCRERPRRFGARGELHQFG